MPIAIPTTDDDVIDAGALFTNINGLAGLDTLILDYSTATYNGSPINRLWLSNSPNTMPGPIPTIMFYHDQTRDEFYIYGFEKYDITGTNGDDLLTGFDSSLGNHFYGLAGDDGLIASIGDDILDGGDGDDGFYIYANTAGPNDLIDGGNGIDRLSLGLQDRTDDIVIDMLAGVADGATLKSVELLSGTLGSGDDTVIVGRLSGVISGGLGTDTILIDCSDSGLNSTPYNSINFLGNLYYPIITYWNYGSYDNAQMFSFENFEVIGTSGSDALLGGAGADIFHAAAGYDQLYGGDGADLLDGGDDSDVLDGGAGIDTMIGGDGDDLYWVDRSADVVVENANEGIDRVYSPVSYALHNVSDNIENLTLTGSANINGIGNSVNNWIIGNTGSNILNGAGGDDRLDGGSGTDTMIGGTGDDVFYVDKATDIVIEHANEGSDYIYASVSYSLRSQGQYIEGLVLVGSTNINGIGNDLTNGITGNTGNNILNGSAGNDFLYGDAGDDVFKDDSGVDNMFGGSGNDTFYVDKGRDVVYEYTNEGTDLVLSSVSYSLRTQSQNIENLTLIGNSGINGIGNDLANIITGNSGNNILNGSVGDDTLIGDAGDDTFRDDAGMDIMTGGSGADHFIWSNGQFGGLTNTDADQITDFSSVEGDKIELVFVDANRLVAGDQAFTFIGTGAFSNAAGQLRYTSNGVDTLIIGDTNGDGIADFAIKLDGSISLQSSDFVL